MSALTDLAHTVTAEPGEVFDEWLDRNRDRLPAGWGDELREAFDLGRSYQLAADAHTLADKLERDSDLRYRREERRRRASRG